MTRARSVLFGLVQAAVVSGAARAFAQTNAPAPRAPEAPAIEIVVHDDGDAPALPPKQPSMAGSVIGEERLRAPGLQASDVLRGEPGVAVAQTGGYGELSTASIRGATAAQTPVYLAGVRINDDLAGTADLSLVPLWMLRRIEIYRSGAPEEADQLGIGGALFFEPRVPRHSEAGAGVMAGSFGAEALFARAGLGDAHGGFLVGLRAERAQNDYSFVDDRGTRFDPSDDRTRARSNADSRTLSGWGLGRVALGRRASLELVAHHIERRQGIPGLTLYPSRRARRRDRRELAALRADLACAGGERCRLRAQTALLAARADYDDPEREIALGTTRLGLDARRIDQQLSLSVRPTPELSLTPALSASLERLGSDSAAAPALRASRVFSRAALSAEWRPLPALGLRALGAIECHGTRAWGSVFWAQSVAMHGARAELCSVFEPSARAGVEIGDARLGLFANAGRYSRVPTLGELYGISGAVRGNAELAPESGLSLDLGLRAQGRRGDVWPLAHAYLDLFGFVRQASELVAYERSGLGYVKPFNVGRARVLGLELLAGLRPVRWLRCELSATLLDPRDRSPARPRNDVLPYRSRLTLAPRVELGGRPTGSPFERASLVLSYFYEASRYADPAGLVLIPAQGSLELEGQLATLGERLEFGGRVSNLFNQNRVDLIGYPLPGRAAYLTLESKW